MFFSVRFVVVVVIVEVVFGFCIYFFMFFCFAFLASPSPSTLASRLWLEVSRASRFQTNRRAPGSIVIVIMVVSE